MKLPAIFSRFRKAAVAPMTVANSPGFVGNGVVGGLLGYIHEAFAGAWQRNLVLDSPQNILAFSAVFACVTGNASDVGKLRPDLKELDGNGIGVLVNPDSPYQRVLRKPNNYQTRIQFYTHWIACKRLHGNTYALIERDDARGLPTALHILDPTRVKVLIAPNGDVYYELSDDALAGVPGGRLAVPASEIIHDREVTLFHPLCGVSPIYACGLSATQGNRIQAQSTRFFENGSRPSGILTTPGKIDTETATRWKDDWQRNYSGENNSKVAVLGGGMTYTPITSMPAADAQLIEQLKWTAEDVARCFHYPMFKLTGAIPVGSTVEALQNMYLADCLHPLIESLESALDDGLGLSAKGYYVEFDLTGLLRMDTQQRFDALSKAVGGGWMKPNEARWREDLMPVDGGDSPYLQQQNYSLAALAKRDALDDPFNPPKPTPVAPVEPAKPPEDKAVIPFSQKRARAREAMERVLKEAA